jgi:hypothetical protein
VICYGGEMSTNRRGGDDHAVPSHPAGLARRVHHKESSRPVGHQAVELSLVEPQPHERIGGMPVVAGRPGCPS